MDDEYFKSAMGNGKIGADMSNSVDPLLVNLAYSHPVTTDVP